jgi:DNA-binding beta-propeller fold protein YncE
VQRITLKCRAAARLAAVVLVLTLTPLVLPRAQDIDMASVEAAEQFRSGVRLYHRGGFQPAILAFERALSVRPEDDLVAAWLAQANYRAGYLDAAIRGWRDLVARESDDMAAYAARLQYATFRHGLGSELSGEPRWVTAYEIRPRRGGAAAFHRPVSVRALRDGSLAVVSLADNQIVVVDVNGSVLRSLRGGIYSLDRPFDVLEVGDGYVVSEFGGRRIVSLGITGGRQAVLGAGAGAPKVMAPQFLAADPSGYIYTTDAATSRVHKYDPEGAYLLSFGLGLAEPTGVAVRGEEVYVAERGAARISVFDTSGNLLRTLGEGSLSAPEGISFWDDLTLLVADTTSLQAGDLVRDSWSDWGGLGTRARRLTSVAVDSGGTLYLTDMDAEVIYVLTRQANLVVGNNVTIARIGSDAYPNVTMAVSVTDRYGRPITGLKRANFLLYEAGASVGSFTLARTPVDPAQLDVVLVVDQSPAIADRAAALRAGTLDLYDELARAGRFAVVAGENPTVVAPAGTTRLRTAEAAAAGGPSTRWSLESALRVAANELAVSWSRKAVVYLTAGGLGRRPFEATTLAEAAAALMNDNAVFVVVSLSDEPIPEELSYLARSTGGRVIAYSNPRGVTGLAGELGTVPSPVYQLRYVSSVFPDFGRRYLPVKVEVVLPGPSGGDLSGYFAPTDR